MTTRRIVLLLVTVALTLALPASFAAAAPLQYGYTCVAYHTVRFGDTMNSISGYYRVSMQALMAANGIANPNVIYAGQTLCIPGAASQPPQPPPCGTYYTVKWGDTLSTISARYGVSMYAIMQANNIWNPNYIYAGMILYVPCSSTYPPNHPPPSSSCAAWRGEYFNNANLAGAPSVVRCDAAIAFNWGVGWPTPKISADNFSVRWTRTVKLNQGTYRFTVQIDDGARVFVDNVLVLDQWHPATGLTYVVDVPLGTGTHVIRMEYYEGTGIAYAYLSYALVAAPPVPSQPIATPMPGLTPTPGTTPTPSSAPVTSGGAWNCTWYRNQFLDFPAYYAIVPNIIFNWGKGSPAPGVIPNDLFSMRCDSVQSFPSSGIWQFNAQVDDGVRIYVDGNLVVNEWFDHPGTVAKGTANLSAGPHNVRVEYYEFGRDASITVWTQLLQ